MFNYECTTYIEKRAKEFPVAICSELRRNINVTSGIRCCACRSFKSIGEIAKDLAVK